MCSIIKHRFHLSLTSRIIGTGLEHDERHVSEAIRSRSHRDDCLEHDDQEHFNRIGHCAVILVLDQKTCEVTPDNRGQPIVRFVSRAALTSGSLIPRLDAVDPRHLLSMVTLSF